MFLPLFLPTPPCVSLRRVKNEAEPFSRKRKTSPNPRPGPGRATFLLQRPQNLPLLLSSSCTMSYRPDSVPLQEAVVCPSYPGAGGAQYPGAGGGGQRGFQYTVLEAPQKMPRDHFIWSLCCLLHFNPCCLGFAALLHSVKARDKKVVGDIEGAREYGNTARTLNIISTVLVCLLFIVFIILTVVMFEQITQMIATLQDNKSRFSDYGTFSG